jgi:hypothetical protein
MTIPKLIKIDGLDLSLNNYKDCCFCSEWHLFVFLMQLLQIFGSSPQVAMQIMYTKSADDLVIVAKSEREMKENDEEPGKACEEEKEDENDGVQ